RAATRSKTDPATIAPWTFLVLPSPRTDRRKNATGAPAQHDWMLTAFKCLMKEDFCIAQVRSITLLTSYRPTGPEIAARQRRHGRAVPVDPGVVFAAQPRDLAFRQLAGSEDGAVAELDSIDQTIQVLPGLAVAHGPN